MGTIRPLERGDIPAAASLYEHVARSGSRTPPRGLASYFERTFLDHPWADPEIPSLVYEDDTGTLAGFLGSSVRRLLFEGRTIRLGVSGQLVTEPGVRTQAAGAFLMRKYMDGPQDLTLTDTASETVRRIWEGIGGETAHLHCIGWIRVFRPLGVVDEMVTRRRPGAAFPAARRVLASGVDAVGVRVARGALRPPATAARAEELTAALIAQHVGEVASWARLRPHYEDEEFVSWLLGTTAEIHARGPLVARLVRAGGCVRGWWVALLPDGGIGQVLQVASDPHGIDDVLDHLFHEAWSRGAAGVQGRVEAHLRPALARRRCLLHPSGYLALVHARHTDALSALQSGRALLTRLDGDWCMGHHLLPFESH